MKRFAIAADINRKVRIRPETVAHDRREFRQRDLFLFQPGVARFIDCDIQHIRFEIVRSVLGLRQVDGNILSLVHLEADHHERGEQKEHDVYQRDDLDPRMLAFDWQPQFHWNWFNFPALARTSTLLATVSNSNCSRANFPEK